MGTRLVSAASMATLCQALYGHEIGGLFGPGVLAVPSGMFGCHSSRVDAAQFSWAEATDAD